jgi:D-xylose transport system permease protein
MARAPAGRQLRAAGLDARALGMAVVLAGTWIALAIATDGVFLTPRNLYNLAVQSSAVAVMATGMVLVIAARHIDLSVGSVLGFVGMAIAWLQVEVLPPGAAWSWPLSVAAGLALGAAIGAWQGYWIAWRGVPSFVVTLAGLLIFRGAAYLVTEGRTVAPLDPRFQMLGGGAAGSIGSAWSWALAAAAATALVAMSWRGRSRRRAHGIPLRPLGLELARVAGWVAVIGASTAVMNAYAAPRTGIARGLPIPVGVVVAVAFTMSQVARTTRLGRYVLAIGGDPEAAALAGIDVRRVTLSVFVSMGLLAAVAAVLTAARLGAGTNSMGTLAELSVIAAAVIGGTSLSGGVASVGGALLGAVFMQSLENGMVLLGVSSAARQIWIGLVLMAAVWADAALRRRRP